MRLALFAVVAALGGCVIQVPAPAPAQPESYPPQAEAPPPAEPPPAESPPAEEPAPAVSVYEEPPVAQPAPIAVGWAPPPMLVEAPPPTPFAGAVWVGGYWVWQGNWVWAHGHWMGPPHQDYVWVHPYYEHRGDAVIFIDGHWSAPGVAFVPPPPGLRLAVETPAYGVIPGPRPMGPEGCFVPAPPGSRAGIIVPAPVGTAPAVVTSAPPVVAVGMRINSNVTTVNNVTNVTNITRVTNVTNVTIVAPAGATASGRAYNTVVPAAPHLAAARPALVQARAPEPVNTRPLPVYTPGSRPPALPHPPPMHAQPVNAGMTPARSGEAQAAHPTPTALGHDPQHVNPDSARSERPYAGGYEHQPSQAQSERKAPPQPQSDHKAPPQPQSASRPAPPQNAYHPAPQPQNEHRNATPQSAAPQSQSPHQAAPGHEGDNHAHKPEAQSQHDAKHERPGEEH